MLSVSQAPYAHVVNISCHLSGDKQIIIRCCELPTCITFRTVNLVLMCSVYKGPSDESNIVASAVAIASHLFELK